jgi:hypothetical protein
LFRVCDGGISRADRADHEFFNMRRTK